MKRNENDRKRTKTKQNLKTNKQQSHRNEQTKTNVWKREKTIITKINGKAKKARDTFQACMRRCVDVGPTHRSILLSFTLVSKRALSCAPSLTVACCCVSYARFELRSETHRNMFFTCKTALNEHSVNAFNPTVALCLVCAASVYVHACGGAWM